MRREHDGAHDGAREAARVHASEKSATSEVINGTITILAVVLALEYSSSGPWQALLGVVGTALALALGRAYADAIAAILLRERRLERSVLRIIWGEAWPVTVYAPLPALAFALSALGLLPLGASFAISQVSGVLVLSYAGYHVGKGVGLSLPRRLLSGLVVAGLGGLVILLRALTQ